MELNKDGRNWNFIYKSAYSQLFKRVKYSPPVSDGQLDPKRIQWSMQTLGFRDIPHIFHAVNKKAGPTFAFAKTAIEDELANIKAAFKESKKKQIAFEEIIVEKHTITVLLAAVRLHCDKPHKSVEKGDQDCSFLEYKCVFEVPSKTG